MRRDLTAGVRAGAGRGLAPGRALLVVGLCFAALANLAARGEAADLAGPAAAPPPPPPPSGQVLAPVPMAQQPQPGFIAIAPAPPPNSVFVFAGQFTMERMAWSIDPFTARHESNYIVGGAYNRDFFYLPGGFIVGGEIGVADRFGMGQSAELWGGISIRHSGIVFFNTLRVAPGITLGFSGITNAVGTEANRERDRNGNAHFLGYLGPELALALQDYPNWEAVYRLQHRSGALGTLGNMTEGANANVFGVRYRF